jgi:hypothetical protein
MLVGIVALFARSTRPPARPPHRPVEGDGLDRLQGAADAGSTSVQGVAEDVDLQQLAAFGLPARPLGL